jgi:hypothetical protein
MTRKYSWGRIMAGVGLGYQATSIPEYQVFRKIVYQGSSNQCISLSDILIFWL